MRTLQVPAFCGETLMAYGRAADGRVAQGSAVVREGGPNEIILRLSSP
jgi:hypothetical protein